MRRFELVVVGTSWGGLNALTVLLGLLPKDYSLPVVVVQHRSRESDDTLSAVLQRATDLKVRECEDKEPLQGGSVYVAPADYHVLLEKGAIALSTDEAVGFSRPSIDVLFESAAVSYGKGVIAVLLTGANQDGAKGLAYVQAAGGYIIVQNPQTAESPVMPQAGIASIKADRILDLPEIAVCLAELGNSKASGVQVASAGQR